MTKFKEVEPHVRFIEYMEQNNQNKKKHDITSISFHLEEPNLALFEQYKQVDKKLVKAKSNDNKEVSAIQFNFKDPLSYEKFLEHLNNVQKAQDLKEASPEGSGYMRHAGYSTDKVIIDRGFTDGQYIVQVRPDTIFKLSKDLYKDFFEKHSIVNNYLRNSFNGTFFSSGNRFHLFEVNSKSVSDELRATHPSRGDALKRSILKELKKQITLIPSQEDLNTFKKNLVNTKEYEILNTGQGLFTRLFGRFGVKTSSIKALEDMLRQKEAIFNEENKTEAMPKDGPSSRFRP